MLTNVSSSIFTNSKSIQMLPFVSAEWNHNLFNPPYLTVAGNGTKLTPTTSDSLTSITDSNKHPNFTTNSFALVSGAKKITYTIADPSLTFYAYKVVMYAKTTSDSPILINTYANGTSGQIGSSSVEIDTFGWTKIETYIGSPNLIASATTLAISASTINSLTTTPTIYITVPEVYITTKFDYQYGSLWPTDSAVKFLRSGESYVGTGNTNISFPTDYRLATNANLNGGSGGVNMPINPIVYNPKFLLANIPIPIYKNGVANDVLPYQYFVSSDTDSEKVITALYEKNLMSNKIVLKFNVLMSIPTVTVKLDGTSIGSFTPNSNGLITLYYSGTAWSTTKWTNSGMPKFSANGELTPTYAQFKKITITRSSESLQTAFNTDTYSSQAAEMKRLQVIEISPRLEINLSDFVQDVSINKSLDSKNNYVPISSINSNDASITLSGIPTKTVSNFTPIFSSQSDSSRTILSNILRKNIKFYIHYNLLSYDATDVSSSNTYIPGGVFYSDSWQENDIDSVSVQAYDVSRYLQTTPVPDYVSTLKPVFDVIAGLLDGAGFTDYDYDSLYTVTNDLYSPMDMFYYFASAKDTTLIDALSEIFLAYQIGAYIDEYGIMKFLSLSKILTPKAEDITISDSDVVENGYSVSNKAKPGKISLRYNPPKIKQSLSLQNAQNIGIKNSPSFIITTSNDVVWSQQNLDSVGFNYLNDSMGIDDNKFKLDVNDLLDIMHTYSLSNDGYAIIEDEIVSFAYKQYTISSGANSVTVSVKNDLELQAEVSKFSKKYQIQLKNTIAEVSSIATSGTAITYSATNNYAVGDKVSITGASNTKFNLQNKLITAATGSSFTVASTLTGSLTGTFPIATATSNAENNITISPTGYITNIKRGLFGTKVSSHNLISTLTSKNLSQGTINSSYAITTGGTNASVDAVNYNIPISSEVEKKTIVYPSQLDTGYQTYSTKFKIMTGESVNGFTVVGGIFFNMPSTSSSNGTYFVEICRCLPTGASSYKYYAAIYQVLSGIETIIAWADITAQAVAAISHMPKVHKKNTSWNIQSSADVTKYFIVTDQMFSLKVVHYKDTKNNGNVLVDNDEVLRVFLNNIEINSWQIPVGGSSATITNAVKTLGSITYTANNSFAIDDYVFIDGITPTNYNQYGVITAANATSFTIHISSADWFVDQTFPSYTSGGTAIKLSGLSDTAYKPVGVNLTTLMMKKVVLPTAVNTNTIFGAFGSSSTIIKRLSIDSNIVDLTSTTGVIVLNEISATKAALKEKSVNYFYQDRNFLNGILQGQKAVENNYVMQTKPEVIGMNYYDVQYTNPAASIVDVLPVEYLWYYFPGSEPSDQKYYQKQVVDEYAVAYSTPINTGFKAKMMIVNNSRHLVYLNKDSDDLNAINVRLNLWTHEIVAPSDQQIIEKNVDISNISEVAQIDSQWIQSFDAANKMLKLIGKGLEGFSKDVSLEIFGNPLIQVGDVITLTYALNGINQQKYIVHSVSQSFQQGLSTKLMLNKIGNGTAI